MRLSDRAQDIERWQRELEKTLREVDAEAATLQEWMMPDIWFPVTSFIGRADRKSQTRQCLGFVQLIFGPRAVQKPKHCLTWHFWLPLFICAQILRTCPRWANMRAVEKTAVTDYYYQTSRQDFLCMTNWPIWTCAGWSNWFLHRKLKYSVCYLHKHIQYFNFRSKIQLDHPVLDFVAEFVRHWIPLQ